MRAEHLYKGFNIQIETFPVDVRPIWKHPFKSGKCTATITITKEDETEPYIPPYSLREAETCFFANERAALTEGQKQGEKMVDKLLTCC